MIPSRTSIDLELRLSNSGATSLLCDRNRLRLRQLPFLCLPRFRWQPLTVPSSTPKVNPVFLSASRNLCAPTTAERPAFLPATAVSELTPFVLRGRKYAISLRIPQPPVLTRIERAVCRSPGVQRFVSGRQQKAAAESGRRRPMLFSIGEVRADNPAASRRELVFGRCNDERVAHGSHRSLPDNTTSNQQTKNRPA